VARASGAVRGSCARPGWPTAAGRAGRGAGLAPETPAGRADAPVAGFAPPTAGPGAAGGVAVEPVRAEALSAPLAPPPAALVARCALFCQLAVPARAICTATAPARERPISIAAPGAAKPAPARTPAPAVPAPPGPPPPPTRPPRARAPRPRLAARGHGAGRRTASLGN